MSAVSHDLRPAAVTVLAQSGAGWTTPADTSEDTLVSISVPAGAMGPNGRIEIDTLWSYSGTGNKTMKVKFGGTAFLNTAQTTNATGQTRTVIANRNATNSQVGFVANTMAPYAGSASALVTSSVDTTAAVTIDITGQKATSGETLKLEAYSVRLIRG